LGLSRDWLDHYNLREFHALLKRKHEADDARWMQASIVATMIRNVNCSEKSDQIPFDYFVPKRGAKPAEERDEAADKAEYLKQKAVLFQAKFQARFTPPKTKI
jgi:hypothetical protein